MVSPINSMPGFSPVPDPAFWKGRRVLITGHTGFKGSWLSLWLLRLGAHVIGLSLEAEGDVNLFTQLGLPDRLDHNIGDIRDPSIVQDLVLKKSPEFVFHLAAQPLVRQSYDQPLLTWTTNVVGTINLLESLRKVCHPCFAVIITTDKVYSNNDSLHGYRETDPLGGDDPYSSSKAASELVAASWRSSFCGLAEHQTPYLRIASARAGNVIGGGDWALDRIIPDAIRSLSEHTKVRIRNPNSTRPWQHVLEPLSGYLLLAQHLCSSNDFARAYNFGPHTESNRTVGELVGEVLRYWPGQYIESVDPRAPHEASLLHLNSDLAYHHFGWSPTWDFATTVQRTVDWYRNMHEGISSATDCCQADLASYEASISS